VTGRSGAPGRPASPDARDGDDGAEHDVGLTLTAALKLTGLAATGGHAKRMIQAGEVRVNGRVETRRKHRLRDGDEIEVAGESFVIEREADGDGDAAGGA
jgi:ribosome-associated protein